MVRATCRSNCREQCGLRKGTGEPLGVVTRAIGTGGQYTPSLATAPYAAVSSSADVGEKPSVNPAWCWVVTAWAIDCFVSVDCGRLSVVMPSPRAVRTIGVSSQPKNWSSRPTKYVFTDCGSA